jgi:hypothetical protein
LLVSWSGTATSRRVVDEEVIKGRTIQEDLNPTFAGRGSRENGGAGEINLDVSAIAEVHGTVGNVESNLTRIKGGRLSARDGRAELLNGDGHGTKVPQSKD